MQLIDIVADGLRKEGYNGLCVPGVCYCSVDNIAPSGCMSCACDPGYKHAHTVIGEWIITKSKEQPSDEIFDQFC